MNAYISEYDHLKRKAVVNYYAQYNAILPISEDNPQKREEQLLDLFRDMFSPTVQLTDIGGCITSDTCSSPHLSSVDNGKFGLDYDVYEFTDDASETDTAQSQLYSERKMYRVRAQSGNNLSFLDKTTENSSFSHSEQKNSLDSEATDGMDVDIHRQLPMDSISTFYPINSHHDINEKGKPIRKPKAEMSTTSNTERAKSNGYHSSSDFLKCSTAELLNRTPIMSTIQIINEPFPTDIENNNKIDSFEVLHHPTLKQINGILETAGDSQTKKRKRKSSNLKMTMKRIGSRDRKISYKINNDASVFLNKIPKQKRKLYLDNTEILQDLEENPGNGMHNGISKEDSPQPAKKKKVPTATLR